MRATTWPGDGNGRSARSALTSRSIGACVVAGALLVPSDPWNVVRLQKAAERRELRQESGLAHSAVMSPSVEATWAVVEQGGENRLELLVLWRGQPGWFQRQPAGFTNNGVEQTIVRGLIRLTMRYEAHSRVLHVQGIRKELGVDNVVFIDEVDSPGGARVVGQLRVGSAIAGSAAQIGPLLARSPRIMAFLRCDVVPIGLEGRAWLKALCLQTTGVAK